MFGEGSSTEVIARTISVQQATAEVYVIDAMAAGARIDFIRLSEELNITPDLFNTVHAAIVPAVSRLRELKDLLPEASYNQIRFIIACKMYDCVIE